MIDQKFLDSIGVFQGPDGTYLRHRIRDKDAVYADVPNAVAKGLVESYDEELVPFKVVLPLATDPDSISEAQAKARAQGADFYHPRFGWLRWGVKRETDHPENLGSGSERHERRRVVVNAPAGAGTKKGA